MMRGILWGLSTLILSICFPRFALAEGTEVGSYTREFRFLDSFASTKDKEAWVTVVDKMQVRSAGNNSVEFEVEISGANAHSCGLSGKAKKKGSYYEISTQEKWMDKPCVLQLHFENQNVILKDIGWHCKTYFCGARAAFDGVVFRRSIQESNRENQFMEKANNPSEPTR